MTKEKVSTVKKLEGNPYLVRTDSEWGVIVITGNTFLAHTSYGSYNNYWPAPGEDFVKFLGNLDYSYAMGKFTGSRYGTIFDHEKSVEQVQKAIIERRRNDYCTKQEARDAWEVLQGMDHHRREEDFIRYLAESEDIVDALCGDEWPYEVLSGYTGTCNDPQCVGFWNDIYIPFLNEVCPGHKVKKVTIR